jgi:hypothetical protein
MHQPSEKIGSFEYIREKIKFKWDDWKSDVFVSIDGVLKAVVKQKTPVA